MSFWSIWSLNIYSSSGESVRTIDVRETEQPRCLAYDGAHIVLLTPTGVFRLPSSGGSLERLQLPEAKIEAQAASIFLVAGEPPELWVAEWRTQSVHRYTLK